MVYSRVDGRFAVVLVVGSLVAVAARSQETPTAESRPEDVLKGKALKRSGTTWVLGNEISVLKDLRDARELYRHVEQGMMQQHGLEMASQDRKGELEHLRAQSNALSQNVTQYDQQLEALVSPPGGNNLVAAQRDQVAQERNQVVAALNQVNNRLNQLQDQKQDQDQDQKLTLNAEVAEAREKYMQSVIDLRKGVDEVMAKYDALARDAEITKAIDALSAASKTKQHLGPSKALRDAIKILEKAEGSVKSETIELHREGGVFHVYATLGKVPTKMVFDTGAAVTTISAKLASRIGLKPPSSDQTMQLKTADGTVVQAKRMTIPSVRVGKFTVPNVECAVMPEKNGDVDPLLGQSFFKFFDVKFSPDAGRLSLKRLETPESEAADARALAGSGPTAGTNGEAKPAGKAVTKSKRPTRQPKPPAKTKTKRGTKARPDSGAAEDTDAAGGAAPPQ